MIIQNISQNIYLRVRVQNFHLYWPYHQSRIAVVVEVVANQLMVFRGRLGWEKVQRSVAKLVDTLI